MSGLHTRGYRPGPGERAQDRPGWISTYRVARAAARTLPVGARDVVVTVTAPNSAHVSAVLPAHIEAAEVVVELVLA